MIKLKLNREPEWLDLVAGVRVLVKPMRTMIMAEAGSAPALRELPEDADRDVRYTVLCAEIAKLAILEWEGVGDDDDNPVVPTPEGIAALMDIAVISRAFSASYVTPSLQVSAEKNA